MFSGAVSCSRRTRDPLTPSGRPTPAPAGGPALTREEAYGDVLVRRLRAGPPRRHPRLAPAARGAAAVGGPVPRVGRGPLARQRSPGYTAGPGRGHRPVRRRRPHVRGPGTGRAG